MKLSCPFCGQHIEIEEAGRYQCPACNKVFEVEEETPTTQATACPYCTAPVSTAARKCPHCGEWIKEKPKNRAVYLILAFLFGNLGIAEFYAGRIFNGCVILILNTLCLFSGEAYTLLIPYFISLIIALLSNVGIEDKREYKKRIKRLLLIVLAVTFLLILPISTFIYLYVKRFNQRVQELINSAEVTLQR